MKIFMRLFSLIKERKNLYMTFLLFYLLLPVSWGASGLRRRWRQFCHKEEEEKVFSILVIQLMKIGDVVCTTPVFRELRSRYPQAHITAMVLPLAIGILEHNPHVDEIIPYDPSAVETSLSKTLSFIKTLITCQFDWSVNFSPNFRNIAYTCFALIPNRICIRTPYCSRMTKAVYWTHTGRHDYDSRTSAMRAYLETLRLIGITGYSMKKEVHVHPDDSYCVNKFLENHNIDSEDTLIAIHPFAGVEMKEWGEEKFVVMAERLTEQYNAKILLIGASQDREKAEKMINRTKYPLINTCGEFSLAQLPALIKRCQLFISVDSGPLYIADALGVPVVDIAGPCDLKTQSPDGIYEVVQKSFDCVPCSFIMDAPRTCQRWARECLELVTVDDVLKAVKHLESRVF